MERGIWEESCQHIGNLSTIALATETRLENCVSATEHPLRGLDHSCPHGISISFLEASGW